MSRAVEIDLGGDGISVVITRGSGGGGEEPPGPDVYDEVAEETF